MYTATYCNQGLILIFQFGHSSVSCSLGLACSVHARDQVAQQTKSTDIVTAFFAA